MTNEADSSDRLNRIEAAILGLATAQQRTQEQLDREMTVVAELRTAQVTTNQHIEELAEVVADVAVQVGTLSNRMDASIQQAERDRAEIQRIWQYLREGRNGYSNGNGNDI